MPIGCQHFAGLIEYIYILKIICSSVCYLVTLANWNSFRVSIVTFHSKRSQIVGFSFWDTITIKQKNGKIINFFQSGFLQSLPNGQDFLKSLPTVAIVLVKCRLLGRFYQRLSWNCSVIPQFYIVIRLHYSTI